MFNLSELPLSILSILFCTMAFMVWMAGTRLALLGDELAERLNLTREFVGLFFLAAATELPEIVTTITAAQVDNATLVLGNMFGGITMQTAILAVADIFIVRQALTSWPRKSTHTLLAVLLIVLLSFLLAATLLGDVVVALNIGLAAICLSGAYPVTIALLRTFDEKDSWAPVDLPQENDLDTGHRLSGSPLKDISTGTLLFRFAAASVIILFAGVLLALGADAIAEKTALGSSFVGIVLLAAATSLPELSTTLAAARIGAYTMAMSNIFGSNLIMLALILPADMAYRSGPILAEADLGTQFSIVAGILVTGIYAAGLLIRRTPKLFGAGLDSWLVIVIYLAMLGILFAL